MPMGLAQPPPPPVQNPTLDGLAAANKDDADGPVDDDDSDTDVDMPLCKLGDEKERKDRARAEREQAQRGKAKREDGDEASATTCTRKVAEGAGPGHDCISARDLLVPVRYLQKCTASHLFSS